MALIIHKIANKTYTLKVQLAKSTDLSLGLKTIHCRSETIVMKTRADQGHIEMTTITGPFLKCAMNVDFCLLKTVLQEFAKMLPNYCLEFTLDGKKYKMK